MKQRVRKCSLVRKVLIFNKRSVESNVWKMDVKLERSQVTPTSSERNEKHNGIIRESKKTEDADGNDGVTCSISSLWNRASSLQLPECLEASLIITSLIHTHVHTHPNKLWAPNPLPHSARSLRPSITCLRLLACCCLFLPLPSYPSTPKQPPREQGANLLQCQASVCRLQWCPKH